jgi:hypothetical protein
MIISGVPTSLRTVFTQTHHHQHLRTSQRQRPGRTTIYPAPPGDATLAPSPESRARYRRQNPTRNYPSSSKWSDTMPVQYDHLPVVNSATLFMDTDCVCYELWTTVSPSPPPYVLLPVSLHDRCQPAQKLCEMPYSIHSRIGIPCRRRGRTRTGTCTGGRQNALDSLPSTRPTLSGSTKNAQAPVKRSSL